MFRFLPSPDSEFAPVVDNIINLVTDLSVFFTVLIVGTMIYFAVKYRKKNGIDHPTPHIEGSTFLEICWTVLPTIVCIFIAAYGVYGYRVMRTPPSDAIEINVKGKKWNWTFNYNNGKETVGEFAVPVNKPIKLIITAEDVLHSFFVPGMRTKVDAVPGHYSYQWFKPIKVGPQQVYCTEYCGEQHSGMLATMHVMPEAEYERWLSKKEVVAEDPAGRGKQLYTKNCASCHTLDGTRLVGPSFLKLYGREGEFESGTTYKADENYISESILYPGKNIVKGYPALMPGFEGVLDNNQISDLIAYIKTIDGQTKQVSASDFDLDSASVAKSPEEQKYDELKAAVPAVAQCSACHNITGAAGGVGPTWKGLYGRSGKFQDGTEYVANDEYIKQSILEPNKNIVSGYAPAMPSYAGQLKDEEIDKIIEYLKQIK